MAHVLPCKGSFRSCTIKGVDFTEYAHLIRVYENIKKPYLTATLVILDNNNLVENLQIVGGEEVSFAFHSPPNNKTYEAKLNVLSLKGYQAQSSVKFQSYNFELIGPIFYQDKANLVQKAFGNVTGTAAIQQIWNQYLNKDTLKVVSDSLGMIGKQDDATTIENKKPLAAIDQLKKLLAGGDYKNGTPLLFRDNTNVNLVSLENLYNSLSATDHYIQSETWGINFFDPNLYRVIIVAQAEVEEGEGGGKSNIQDIASTVNQSQIVFDMFKGQIAKNSPAKMITAGGFGGGKGIGSLVGSLLSLGAGSIGGAPNVQVTQSNRWERGNAPDTKTMGERRYVNEAKGGPLLRIKVPMQTGLNATVGKGVEVTLVPPHGDFTNVNINSYSMNGKWLVREVCHELYTDAREVQATTMMLLMRGGLEA